MLTDLESVAKCMQEYFDELDSSLHKLSHLREGFVANLPTWVFSHRRITVGISDQHQVCVYSVTPDLSLDEDEVLVSAVTSDVHLQQMIAPYALASVLEMAAKGLAFELGDVSFVSDKPHVMPKEFFAGIRGYSLLNDVSQRFSIERAKMEALDLWGNAVNGLEGRAPFLHSAGQVFRKFECLVKLKNYRERQIHRYIRDHNKLLLPNFKNCFFEHRLYSEKEKDQKADFILERETMFPSLLIELESPSAKLLKRNGELTAEANHAREQIARWVELIDEDPRNSEGEMAFLRGPKQRLIVMGRGSESDLYNSRYSDTRIWTYEVLLREAKGNWNGILAEQCRLLGIDSPPSFA